jgi:opacity protein-like surface antigen
MKQLLLVTAISFSSLAYADNGFYTSLKAGISDTKFDNSKDQITSYESDVSFNETFHNKDADKSIYPSISAAVGFDFSKISNVNARAELEYTYKDKAKFSPSINKVTVEFDGNSETIDAPEGISSFFINELRTQSLMFNAYYDFKNTSKFTPYVSAGAGVTRVKNTQTLNPQFSEEVNLGLSDTSNSFTWSAGAGVAYKVTENVALDLAYRYVDAGEIEFKNSVAQEAAKLKSTADLTSHDYSLGIRYNF